MKRLFCLLSALALLLQPVHAAQPPQRYLALTFDDGPSGELTEQLLEGLAARQVRVTFFVCGYRVEEFPDTLRHIAATRSACTAAGTTTCRRWTTTPPCRI